MAWFDAQAKSREVDASITAEMMYLLIMVMAPLIFWFHAHSLRSFECTEYAEFFWLRFKDITT
jgi:hypothetical protein